MPDSQAAVVVVYITLSVAASVIDVRHRIIPNCLNAAIAALSLVNFSLQSAVGILAALPFFVAAVITDEIGGGDVKFIMANGLVLGFEQCIFGQILSLLPLAAYCLIQQLRPNKSVRSVPLAPFLSLGFILAKFI